MVSNVPDEDSCIPYKILWDNRWNFLIALLFTLFYAVIFAGGGYLFYVYLIQEELPSTTIDSYESVVLIHPEVADSFDFSQNVCSDTDEVVVSTSTGLLSGFKQKVGDREVCTFLGIPFAQPAIGRERFQERFQKTVPIKGWPGIKEVISFRSNCVQLFPDQEEKYIKFVNYNSSEDCLFLNVWSTKINPSKEKSLKPVLIYVHGGFFEFGGSAIETVDGRYMSSHGDAVIVTLNYRLNAFGWLNLDIYEANGNQGLYDIITAVEWVKKNAKHFGGDPEKVTLFGSSAGGLAIGWILSSPKYANLVKRAIFQSGVPIYPPLIGDFLTIHRNNLAAFVGCDFGSEATFFDEPEKVLECMTSLPKERFLRNFASELADIDLDNINLFQLPSHRLVWASFPMVNDDFPHQPWSAYTELGSNIKLTEIMIGYNKDEPSLLLPLVAPDIYNIETGVHLPSNLTTITSFTEYATNYILKRFKELERFRKEISAVIKWIIRKEPDEDEPFNFVKRGIKFITKLISVCPTKIFSEELARINIKSYVYQFSHWSEASTWPEWVGTPHAEELGYVFGVPLGNPGKYMPEDIELSKRMIKTWVDFARDGRPPKQQRKEWKPFDPLYQNIMDINGFNSSVLMEDTDRICDIYRLVLEIPEYDLKRIRTLISVILPEIADSLAEH